MHQPFPDVSVLQGVVWASGRKSTAETVQTLTSAAQYQGARAERASFKSVGRRFWAGFGWSVQELWLHSSGLVKLGPEWTGAKLASNRNWR